MKTATANDLNQRAQRFLSVLNSGKEFVEELLRDSERLQHRIAMLEGSIGSRHDETSRLRDELQKQSDEHQLAVAENRDLAGRYVEIEEQNSNLANLYVVSHQLHSTLDFREVLQIVQEIIINFIGSECFAVLLVDEQSRELRTIAAEGSDTLPGLDSLCVKIGDGRLGQVASTGESFFLREEFDNRARAERPLAVVPLKIKEQVIGLLVIYKLLQQKRAFSATDYELFSLLAGQAATAIFSAKLYTEAERKLNTIQGFLDLLTAS